ncbi:ABC transporter ATP-binding protein [Pelosinus sp. UFO1]|uniref:ABC transporter ATP-binding protein n=1 Tax=Pelosinus sp. UFO1 TaxID=484770 RepID=UPI0004D11B6D|nr:ABC transporter ATP-binding protein [Pelosinus sp. UFO1]AIF52978.1 Xenobiotic-transporting ATPase [Pelosinus sp. UFO1]
MSKHNDSNSTHCGPSFGSEKAKNFSSSAKRLIGYLSKFKRQFIMVLIMVILSTAFTVTAPEILGKVTTALYHGVSTGVFDWSYILRILKLLALIYVLSQVFQFVQNFFMAEITARTIYNLRNDIDQKINKLPLKYLDSKSHGEILSRVTNDIETINSTMQHSLNQILTSLATVLGILMMMFSINIWMSLIAIVVIPLSLLTSAGVIKGSQKYFGRQQAAIGEINGHIEEMYTGHNIIKTFNYEEKSKERFSDINNKIYENAWRAEFFSGTMMPMVSFFGNVGYALIAVVGCILVIQGKIQVGQIQSFTQYTKQFMQPLSTISNLAGTLQSTIAAAERVFAILDEEEELPDNLNATLNNNIQGNVSIENISFGYSKDQTLIRNLTIDVKSGQTVAVVGPTGAGKTTLINLLMRFYDVDSGSIKVDGVDIRDMRRDDLYTIFGMVLQDTWLFHGTVEENLVYGKEGATHEEVVDAVKTAYAHHFIKTLPGGYNMMLNEEANNISQGQKQLLTIARAIIADPQILILDEATSSVDTRTEVLIQKAMNKLMKGRTSFVIAHRLSTIRDADIILVMNHGDVIEQGSHEELMAKGGFYQNLYNSQFENDEVVA